MNRSQLTLFDLPDATPTPKRKRQTTTAKLEGMAEEILAQCDDQGIDPIELVLELEFRQLCETLDQYPRALAKEFVMWLMKRYFKN